MRFAICVPARNEAARLPRFLDAIERLAVPPRATVVLCLLLDSCSDDSGRIAAGYAGRSRHSVRIATARSTTANAGIARRAAMALGVAALGRAGGVLMTTDADSQPRADWLHATMAAIGMADLVAGDVIRTDHEQHHAQDSIEQYYAQLYALRRLIDPLAWEAPATHHHASGANLAIRSEAYAALGGFALLASGEDARLVDDAARLGLRVRRDAASVVHTSARRIGRAQGGLATALHMLDRMGLDAVRVTHPLDQVWQYRHHALARHSFPNSDFVALADAIRLTPDHLRGVARDCPNAEAFAMRVVPEAPGGMRQVPLAMAEDTLRALTHTVSVKAA
nr:glycosyltransferase [Sphingomonas jinjuensis]